MAFNTLGSSAYSTDTATATTTGDADGSQPAVFDEARLPWIVIIAVSSVGALLLVVNVTLVVFFIRRRMRRAKQPKKMVESASSDVSTKSEMLHMYGTETVSTISVKSGGSREESFSDSQIADVRQTGAPGAVRSRSSDVFRFRSERVRGQRGSPTATDGRQGDQGTKLHRSTSCTPTREYPLGVAGAQYSQYGQYGDRSGRGTAPDLVPAGRPACHSPSEVERCAYTPPAARGGLRERTPPPEQLQYTPPSERCVFTGPTQPRSAAIKQLATFGGRASPPPPPPPSGHQEVGLLV
ncbi:hypothetical protein FJT64_026506 [Amphibalanus amphitrite]|uniref:Uncharacterized protein n=1 Tax=Amphibalanus amphitrite TaxID=1232801 RepID=A0A6A4WBE6_AMPAM|nr:hypothetical protein FJT64_026506 [Amphibalanus amphitrite]